MTREEAKELFPVIQAYAEGKTIEILDPHGNWKEAENPLFTDSLTYNSIKYRIKPESKYRPFKTKEECWLELLKHQPFGWVKYGDSICSIQNIVSDNITITDYEELYAFDLNNSFRNIKFTDNTPFGIKEE